MPRFTFSPFTRDPNLQKIKFTRDPNLHISKFTRDPNLHKTKFTHDPNLHENLHKNWFTQIQIYTKPILTQTSKYKNPNLHIVQNSKEGPTYAIFFKSPWYEDLKNNCSGCLTCKCKNTNTQIQLRSKFPIDTTHAICLEQGPQNQWSRVADTQITIVDVSLSLCWLG